MSEQEALRLGTEAKAAAARLAAKQLELRYTAITAPDDGVITSRTATLGAVVPAGQELFRLIRGNRLEWRGELTASQLQTVSLGQTIDLVLPDGSPARATVRQTSPALSDQTRLAVVYADLVPGSHARAGMYASGKIAIGEAAALTVPAECIVVRDGRNYVMELEGAGSTATVRRRAVTVGRRKDEAIEILSGLSGRERLVPRGAGFLDDGDEVRVVGGRWAPA